MLFTAHRRCLRRNFQAYSPAEHAGLKEWDYVHTVNGQEVFEMTHNQVISK